MTISTLSPVAASLSPIASLVLSSPMGSSSSPSSSCPAMPCRTTCLSCSACFWASSVPSLGTNSQSRLALKSHGIGVPLMSAVFVCLLNHANHDLSSQKAQRTRLSILSGSLIGSLVVTCMRRHARTRPYARGRHISSELRDVNIFIRHRRGAIA